MVVVLPIKLDADAFPPVDTSVDNISSCSNAQCYSMNLIKLLTAARLWKGLIVSLVFASDYGIPF